MPGLNYDTQLKVYAQFCSVKQCVVGTLKLWYTAGAKICSHITKTHPAGGKVKNNSGKIVRLPILSTAIFVTHNNTIVLA